MRSPSRRSFAALRLVIFQLAQICIRGLYFPGGCALQVRRMTQVELQLHLAGRTYFGYQLNYLRARAEKFRAV
jgi:hypothetical protein